MKKTNAENKRCELAPRCVILFALLQAVQILFAQDQPIKFERIGLEQGLSQSTVYSILQDRQGFMWFGTQGGLNKFDGYNFTSYQQNIFDSTSIATNNVHAVYEDHTGTIWAGDPNAACLNRFDRAKEKFTRFVHDPKKPHSLSPAGINVIYEDHTGTLWVGTSNGLNKFDREKEQFTRYLYEPKDSTSLHGYSVFSIYEDRAGTLWIGTGRWLNKFDRTKEQFTSYQYDPHTPLDRSARPITAIYEDHAGTLWVGSEGAGLKKFDRETAQFTAFVHDPENPHSLSSDSVRAIFEDRFGALWIGTFGGLNRFEREQERFTHFKHDSKNPYSLGDNFVWSIYEDRSGVLWIGTHLGGVNKFDRGKEQFTTVAHEPNNPHSLSSNNVFSFYKDHIGILWVGTAEGLNFLNRDAKQFTHFLHDQKKLNSLGDNNVYAIYEDHLGMLWLGTKLGLDKFDPVTKRFTHFIPDPKNPKSQNNLVTFIYGDRYNFIWIGTYGGGLYKFDPEKERFTHFVPDEKNPYSIRSGYIWAICEDSLSRDILWVAASGVNRFNRNTERFTHFVNDPKNPNSLSHDYVGPLCVDHSGTLWVGTLGGGLNRFDRNTEQFSHFTTKDGLSDNQIVGILEDDHDRLWLSTVNGLSRFDPQTKIFRNYDVADGLTSNEFGMPGQHKSVDGEMFFTSFNSGFTRFHPDSIKDNPYLPPVVITSFKRYNTEEAEGKPIIEKGIAAKQVLTLSYKDNVLAFEFAALSYRNTFKNQYAYKLEGLSDNWIQLGTKRDITFTNLDPGKYTLRVKGSNNDGVWNEEGASLKITITPPWWKTTLAYMFYGLLTISGFVATNRVQRRRLIKREYERAQIREGKFRAEAAEAKALALQTENERKKNVELLSEIGKEITASLDMDTIFYKLYERVNQLTDATVFGVGIYHPAKEQIEYRLAIERGKRYAPYTRDTRDKNQFPVWCIEHRRPVFINDVTVEYGRYIDEFKSANVEGMVLENGALPEEPLSLIYLPLISQDQVLGVITIQSFQKNAYTEYHLNLLQSLAAYTTIALDNADAYRRLDATLQHLKSTQQQLITQEKLASLGQLTAGIAHEIKNPLNFVNNFAALTVDLAAELREEIAKIEGGDLNIEDGGSKIVDGEKLVKIEDGGLRVVDGESLANIKDILATLEQNAEKINHHGKRADGIVKSMMQHARGSSGQRELADINHLLDDAVNLTYHGMRANDATFNITIEKDYDESIGKLEVVPQDLSRVFLNIVNNAAYAAHQKKKETRDRFSPTLSVVTKGGSDKIEIRIRDNGNGIPKDIREKIFNPFFTTKPTGQGTGLGLSISHDIIVQEHRGEIRVETEEGKFTEFVVRLPRS